MLVLRNRGRLCVLNWITCFNLERPVQFPPSLFYTQTGPLTDDRFTTLDRHPHTQHDSCSHTLVALAARIHTHTHKNVLPDMLDGVQGVCVRESLLAETLYSAPPIHRMPRPLHCPSGVARSRDCNRNLKEMRIREVEE